jgi:large subunit ribosomal protein L9
MATELLLLSDVEHLGKAGDLVKVADGYARNYLLPQDLAAPATKNALRRLEKLRKEREELERKEIAAAQVVADQLKDLAVTIAARSTDGVALFGSVGAIEIIDAVKAAKGIELEKKQIVLENPYKEIGEFNLEIKLHAKVKAEIKVAIVEE